MLPTTRHSLYVTLSKAEWWDYNATTPNTYRFVGNTALETGVSLYRTYWAYDPNYDGEGYTNGGNVTGDSKDFTSINGVPTELNEKFGEENPLYCLENTFNTANMRKDQTTRVIVAVKIWASLAQMQQVEASSFLTA